jgi:hypothetical protein
MIIKGREGVLVDLGSGEKIREDRVILFKRRSLGGP